MSLMLMVLTSNNGVDLIILGLSVASTMYDSGVYRAPTMFAKLDSNLSLFAVQLEWPLSSGSSMIPSSSPSKVFSAGVGLVHCYECPTRIFVDIHCIGDGIKAPHGLGKMK